MNSAFLLLLVLCWASFAGVAAKKKLCRAKCSADPDTDPCDDPVPEIPRFLLAGQSNAQGFSGEAMNSLFKKTVKVIHHEKFRKPVPTTPEAEEERQIAVTRRLERVIGQAKGAREGSTSNEAKLLYEMAGSNKTTSELNKRSILKPHTDVVCSYSRPDQTDAIDCERPVSPIEGETCGGGKNNYFGPELMFAHHFRNLDTVYKNTTFGITKVAVGGTKIRQFLKGDQSPKYDNYWQSLQDNIRADKGTLEAFFWFQGENDHFPEFISQELYYERLVDLVKKVRKEIYNAHRKRWGKEGSPTAKWKYRNEVPVVIFELGPWIGNGVAADDGGPGPVILAQRQFVEKDDFAILVNTGTADDPNERLSHYYHFNAPSQLIIGHRLAESFKDLLKTVELEKLWKSANATLNSTSDLVSDPSDPVEP